MVFVNTCNFRTSIGSQSILKMLPLLTPPSEEPSTLKQTSDLLIYYTTLKFKSPALKKRHLIPVAGSLKTASAVSVNPENC